MPQANVGIKFDTGKLSYSLLPQAALSWTVAVLTYGSVKYDRSNWAKVDNPQDRYYDALLRHIEDWRGGEKYDAETNLPHLAHAVCCALFLLGIEHASISDLSERFAYALSVARKIRAARESHQEETGSSSPPVA